MLIETVSTPNPHVRKYEPVVEEHQEPPFAHTPSGYWNKETNPLPEGLPGKLFAIEGVCGILSRPNFVSVTKEKDTPWDVLNAHVLEILQQAILEKETQTQNTQHQQDAPSVSITGMPSVAEEDQPVAKKIASLLETHVQPAVARDGGELRFHDYHDGIVVLEMRGACSGCPSSMVTLKQGVERLLTTMIPEVQEVRALLESSQL